MPARASATLGAGAGPEGTSEPAGGLAKRTNDWGWGVEGYTGKDSAGREDSGLRAVFSRRF